MGAINAPGDTFTNQQVVKTGTITAADVRAATGFNGRFRTLLTQIRAGNTYVNVHSVAAGRGDPFPDHPAGLIPFARRDVRWRRIV